MKRIIIATSLASLASQEQLNQTLIEAKQNPLVKAPYKQWLKQQKQNKQREQNAQINEYLQKTLEPKTTFQTFMSLIIGDEPQPFNSKQQLQRLFPNIYKAIVQQHEGPRTVLAQIINTKTQINGLQDTVKILKLMQNIYANQGLSYIIQTVEYDPEDLFKNKQIKSFEDKVMFIYRQGFIQILKKSMYDKYILFRDYKLPLILPYDDGNAALAGGYVTKYMRQSVQWIQKLQDGQISFDQFKTKIEFCISTMSTYQAHVDKMIKIANPKSDFFLQQGYNKLKKLNGKIMQSIWMYKSIQQEMRDMKLSEKPDVFTSDSWQYYLRANKAVMQQVNNLLKELAEPSHGQQFKIIQGIIQTLQRFDQSGSPNKQLYKYEQLFRHYFSYAESPYLIKSPQLFEILSQNIKIMNNPDTTFSKSFSFYDLVQNKLKLTSRNRFHIANINPFASEVNNQIQQIANCQIKIAQDQTTLTFVQKNLKCSVDLSNSCINPNKKSTIFNLQKKIKQQEQKIGTMTGLWNVITGEQSALRFIARQIKDITVGITKSLTKNIRQTLAAWIDQQVQDQMLNNSYLTAAFHQAGALGVVSSIIATVSIFMLTKNSNLIILGFIFFIKHFMSSYSTLPQLLANMIASGYTSSSMALAVLTFYSTFSFFGIQFFIVQAISIGLIGPILGNLLMPILIYYLVRTKKGIQILGIIRQKKEKLVDKIAKSITFIIQNLIFRAIKIILGLISKIFNIIFTIFGGFIVFLLRLRSQNVGDAFQKTLKQQQSLTKIIGFDVSDQSLKQRNRLFKQYNSQQTLQKIKKLQQILSKAKAHQDTKKQVLFSISSLNQTKKHLQNLIKDGNLQAIKNKFQKISYSQHLEILNGWKTQNQVQNQIYNILQQVLIPLKSQQPLSKQVKSLIETTIQQTQNFTFFKSFILQLLMVQNSQFNKYTQDFFTKTMIQASNSNAQGTQIYRKLIQQFNLKQKSTINEHLQQIQKLKLKLGQLKNQQKQDYVQVVQLLNNKIKQQKQLNLIKTQQWISFFENVQQFKNNEVFIKQYIDAFWNDIKNSNQLQPQIISQVEQMIDLIKSQVKSEHKLKQILIYIKNLISVIFYLRSLAVNQQNLVQNKQLLGKDRQMQIDNKISQIRSQIRQINEKMRKIRQKQDYKQKTLQLYNFFATHKLKSHKFQI